MRNEKEIRSRRDYLIVLEQKHAQYIKEMVARDEIECMDVENDIANMIVIERQTLDWVLKENNI